MEDMNWVFHTVWDKKEGVEGAQSTVHPGWCPTVPKVRERDY